MTIKDTSFTIISTELIDNNSKINVRVYYKDNLNGRRREFIETVSGDIPRPTERPLTLRPFKYIHLLFTIVDIRNVRDEKVEIELYVKEKRMSEMTLELKG